MCCWISRMFNLCKMCTIYNLKFHHETNLHKLVFATISQGTLGTSFKARISVLPCMHCAGNVADGLPGKQSGHLNHSTIKLNPLHHKHITILLTPVTMLLHHIILPTFTLTEPGSSPLRHKTMLLWHITVILWQISVLLWHITVIL